MKHAALICLAIIFSLSSCVKTDDFPTESTYTFFNNTGVRITFDLYGSKTDYGQNKNQIHSYFIQPGGSQGIKLKIGEKYWIDWYSDNYSLNNWASTIFNPTAQPIPELSVAAEDDNRVISTFAPDTIRSIMLNGSGTSSTWKGTLTGTGTWDGTHEFTFRKDFTCDHVFTNTSGVVTRRSITYQIEDVSSSGGLTERFTLRTLSQQSSLDFRLTSNLLFGFPTTGRDSLLLAPAFGGSNYGFVRRQ